MSVDIIEAVAIMSGGSVGEARFDGMKCHGGMKA